MGRISMPQGKGSQLHNRRDYEKIGKPLPSNINSELTAENIVLVDKDIKDAYHEIFDESVAEYNAKQKRSDRKIDDYYTHIQKSKNGEKLFYEDVLQWGSKSDFEAPETRQKAAEALKAYVSTFEQRNPNLRLIGAYIHMDEASPHLHLDYIPVASGYKRGLAVRNSLDRAMKQMGYQPENESRKNNATKLWKEHERAVFGDICRDFGLEVEEERKARGSLSVAEYKDARDAMISGIEQEKQALTEEITPLRQLKVNADRVSGTTRTIFPGVVAIKRGDLNLLNMQARAYAVNRSEIKSLRDRAADVSKREKDVSKREKQVDLRSESLSQREQEVVQKEQEVMRMYRRQMSLNQLLENSENQIEKLQKQNAALEALNSSQKDEIGSLKNDIVKLWKLFDDTKRTLTERFKGAVERLGAVCKAVGMLKYDDGGYKANLTVKQERLIDALSNYGIRYARSVDEQKIADDINSHVGISRGINLEIKRLEPRSRSWDLEM